MTNTLSIINTTPKLRIDRTTAVFQTSTTQYSSSTGTYNDTTPQYGGSDSKQRLPPKLITVKKY